MKRFSLLFMILLISFSALAVKLNQRGEKMVSEIRVDFEHCYNSDGFYTIKFGYDSTDEINSVEYRGSAGDHFQLQRENNGEIKGNGKSGDLDIHQTFKIDSQKRPIEMREYERNIYGKYENTWTFLYDYDFKDYDLSIFNIHGADREAQRRDVVKIVEGCAYMSSFGVNMETKSEVKIKMSSENIEYGNHINDLNIDPSQIFSGFAGISGSFGPEYNYLSLVGWIPLKSQHFPRIVSGHDIDYLYDNHGNLVTIKVNVWKHNHYLIKILYEE